LVVGGGICHRLCFGRNRWLRRQKASPDAKGVTSYLAMFSQVGKEAHWMSTTSCRQGMTYKQCGRKDEVSPPKKKAAGR
jgi:hypothetical protein